MTSPSQTTAHLDGQAIVDCWNRIGIRGDGSCAELTLHVHCRNCPVYSAAAVQLLDNLKNPDALTETTAHYSRENQESWQDFRTAFVFRVGAEWLALPIAVLTEVTEPRKLHSLPHHRDGIVLGVVNIRGELLVCISLAGLLSIEAAIGNESDTSNRLRRLLVIQHEGHRVVFPVDEVHGNHRYDPEGLLPLPATVAKASITYIESVLSWQEHRVGLLDHSLLFYTLDRSLA